MDNNQKQIYNSVATLRDGLEDDLRSALTSSNGDLNFLLSNQALIYSQYLEQMDEFAAETLQNYNANAQLDDSYYKLKDEIEEKAAALTSLSAQMNDPTMAASFDPESVTLQVTTNPSTGVISDIRFVPRGSVESGYVETDVRFKVNDLVGGVPISINAIENGSTPDGTQRRMARLGDMKLYGTFDSSAKNDSGLSSEYGLYQLKAEDSASGWSKFWSNTPVEIGRDQGFQLNQFKISGNDIPTNTVVRRGTRLFLTTEDGSLQEFGGANYNEKVTNAFNWLKEMGYENPNVVYYPRPVSEEYLSMPDGAGGRSSRVNATLGLPNSSVNPMAAPSAEPVMSLSPEEPQMSQEQPGFFSSRSGGMSSEVPAQPAAPVNPLASVLPSFFGVDRVNRQNKPDEPPARRTGDIIEAGKSFFRSMG